MAVTTTSTIVALATLVCMTIVQGAPLGEPESYHGLTEEDWRTVENIKAEINVISQKIQWNRPKDIEFHEDENLNNELGDILLTKEQASFLLDEVKQEEQKLLKGSGRVKRRAVVPPNKRWNLPIRYMFDTSHKIENDRRKIRAAFQQITDKTCITFLEIRNRHMYNGAFLNITNVNRMCASFVGQADTAQGQGQDITLSSSCLKNRGTPVHEISHALGLWHEHQRSDREQNIRIMYENIPFWARINFEQAPSDNHHTNDVYDFNSVLQYGPQTSSINMKNTIEPLDSLFYQNMGQRVGLSFLDAKILNNMYCSGECRNSYLQCRHGGYPDPKDCTKCRCPDGLGGTYCDQVAPSELSGANSNMCGGDHTIQGYRWIETPYYGYGSYPLDLACNWKLKAAPGQVIQLQFYDKFGVTSYKNKNIMCNHWIEVKKDSHNFGTPGYRFCGDTTPRAVITSSGEEMLVMFRSLDLSSTDGNRRGVRILVQSINAANAGNPPPQWRTSPKATTRPTSRTTTNKVTSIPTTTNRRPTSTVTTPRATTAVPSTPVRTSLPTTTEKRNFGYEYSWSQWSSCQGNIYCSCGGCSSQTRRRMCNNRDCPREHAKIERKPCDRLCEASDTRFIYIGTFYRATCSQCCKGFTLNNDRTKCVPEYITW